MNNHKKGFYGDRPPAWNSSARIFLFMCVRETLSRYYHTALALIHKKWMRQLFAPTDTKHHTREQLAEDLGSQGAFPPITGRNPCRHPDTRVSVWFLGSLPEWHKAFWYESKKASCRARLNFCSALIKYLVSWTAASLFKLWCLTNDNNAVAWFPRNFNFHNDEEIVSLC